MAELAARHVTWNEAKGTAQNRVRWRALVEDLCSTWERRGLSKLSKLLIQLHCGDLQSHFSPSNKFTIEQRGLSLTLRKPF